MFTKHKFPPKLLHDMSGCVSMCVFWRECAVTRVIYLLIKILYFKH